MSSVLAGVDGDDEVVIYLLLGGLLSGGEGYSLLSYSGRSACRCLLLPCCWSVGVRIHGSVLCTYQL